MSDTLYVTPAQVLAAKLSIELAEEDGEEPDEALKAIANARIVNPEDDVETAALEELTAAVRTVIESHRQRNADRRTTVVGSVDSRSWDVGPLTSSDESTAQDLAAAVDARMTGSERADSYRAWKRYLEEDRSRLAGNPAMVKRIDALIDHVTDVINDAVAEARTSGGEDDKDVRW